MNIRTLAWKNLLRRKSRAVFTGLGIFLGIEHPSVVFSLAIFGAVAGLSLGLIGAIPPARRAAALSPTEAIRSL